MTRPRRATPEQEEHAGQILAAARTAGCYACEHPNSRGPVKPKHSHAVGSPPQDTEQHDAE